VIGALARTAPVRAIGRGAARLAAPVINPLVNAADDASEFLLSKTRPALGLDYSPLPSMPLPGRAAPFGAPTGAATAAPANDLTSLGRQAEARAARFRSVGVDNPTTGMVTRDPRAWHFERETAKAADIGDNLVGQFQDVERKLVATGQNLVRAQGGAKGAENTGIAVQGALNAKSKEMQAVTSQLYKQVRETRGDVPVGRLGGFREAFAHPDIVDDPLADTFRQGIQRRLDRMGMLGPGGKFKDGGAATINQVEELRKFIGRTGDIRDPNTRRIRGILIDSLDDDVVEAVGDDAFKAARASAKERFAEFSKTFPGKVADEGIAPEALTKRVLSDTVRLSDLRSLRQSLTSGTPEQVARGTEALKGLRGQALDDLLGSVVNADGKLNGTALTKAFEKASPKLRILLDPSDYKTLRRLVMASRDATADVPFSAVNHSNTASALFNQTKGPVKDGWLKFLAKHGAAFATVGPAGNVALAAGGQVAAGRAEQKAAEALMRQVQMAKSPQEAAAAIRAAQEAAGSNAAVTDMLLRWQNLAGNSPALGGAAAAPFQGQ
jgi:hypothetical protein